MPYTEFVTPLLKTDAESKARFLAAFPPAASIIQNATGALRQLSGFMSTENDIDVSSEFKLVLALEWNDLTNYQNLVKSDDFKDFGRVLKPFILKPPQPQVFETNIGPKAAFEAPLTEAWRFPAGDEARLKEAQAAWEGFEEAIKRKTSKVHILSGPSANLEERLFLGAIGWTSAELRELTARDAAVSEAATKMRNIDGSSSFTVKLIPGVELANSA